MEMESRRGEKVAGIFGRAWRRLKGLPEGLFAKVVDIAKQARDVATDDPRRVIHSLKAGLALTLVSLLYYLHPLYNNFGVSTMWAVMTVVVVFEFSVGATLGKGLNRALATLLACALGVGTHYLSSITGKTCEPLLLGFFVFVQAVASTFIRFFPAVKARYDYGLLIFILTFCLVSISGFRTHEILELAHKRFSTIAIGASVCVIVSILVCPVWAGEDLHRLVALNMEILGNFLQGFGGEYFKSSDEEESKDGKPSLVGYKSVLNSKSTEEALANFARWEPGHGRFKFRHPWKQYLKIGTLTRQCACRVEALNGYLNSNIQAPEEMRRIIQGICTKMSMESGKALQELASSVRNMNHPSSAKKHMTNSKTAAKNLKLLLSSSFWEDVDDLLQVIPVAAVASILTEIVVCVENIAESVNELAALAQFKEAELPEQCVKSGDMPAAAAEESGGGSGHVVIPVEEMAAPAKPDGHEANHSRCL